MSTDSTPPSATTRGRLERRPLRTLPWHSELASFFAIPERQLIDAVSPGPGTDPARTKEAREALFARFMTPQARELYERVNAADPAQVTDEDRSIVWKTYIFVCLAGERRGFEKLPFFEHLIECLVEPMLEGKKSIKVLDYGCGASVFTRLLAEDFGEKVEPMTADVCVYSVEYTGTRNALYAPKAKAIQLEDVLAAPSFEGLDLILADTVFEHLPNAGEQIQGLIDGLAPGGVLVENYAGSSKVEPHKSDTFSAYRGRDANLDRLASQLTLLFGSLPKKVGGVYEEDGSNRYWIKPGGDAATEHRIRERLRSLDQLGTRVKRLMKRLWKKAKGGMG